DWSPDVCSSDLDPREPDLGHRVTDFESLTGVVNRLVLDTGCGGHDGKRRRWYVVAACPGQHFGIDCVGIRSFATICEGQGEEYHRPNLSPGHRHRQFARN